MQDLGLGGNYRYQDTEIVSALNDALMEARRLRPDLFLTSSPVTFTPPAFTNNDNTPVMIDFQYRMPIVTYMAGMIQLRDMEDVQDNRATQFLAMFKQQLVGL